MSPEEKLRQIARVDLTRQIAKLNPAKGVPDKIATLYVLLFEKEKLAIIEKFEAEAVSTMGGAK